MSKSDPPGQRILPAWNNQQVHVIGHQAVGPHIKLGFGAVLAHPAQVDIPIVFAKEDIPPPVPAMRHMVRKVRKNNASQSSHRNRDRPHRLDLEQALMSILSPYYLQRG